MGHDGGNRGSRDQAVQAPFEVQDLIPLRFQINGDMDVGAGNLLPQGVQGCFVDAEAGGVHPGQGIVGLAEMGVCQTEIPLIEFEGRLKKSDPGFIEKDLVFRGSQPGLAILELLGALFLLGGSLTPAAP